MSDGILSKAATMEIPISSNGDTSSLPEDDGLEQDLQQVMVSGPNLNETSIVSGGYGGTAEGIIPTGTIKGNRAGLGGSEDCHGKNGFVPLIARGLCMTQGFAMAQPRCLLGGLCSHWAQGRNMICTGVDVRAGAGLGGAGSWLASVVSGGFSPSTRDGGEWGCDPWPLPVHPSLCPQEEFGYNAETQKLLCKNGETLLGAVNFFVSSINTLVNKTMEDTLMTVKQYETARLEYDAYRTDLEELSMGPRDAGAVSRLDAAQSQFQSHKDKYEKLRADVAIKLKFLEENKIKVMHKQLLLFHNAISAYFAGNQQQLEQTLKQFNIKLKTPGAEKPSWLEEQ
ncbi:ARFP2 protein, partial [Brachypodius atriceps]|nr:ARFP2 protein [Brachypodius atriceps]